MSRVGDQEPLESSEFFAKDTYSNQLMANSPENLRQLVDLLMNKE